MNGQRGRPRGSGSAQFWLLREIRRFSIDAVEKGEAPVMLLGRPQTPGWDARRMAAKRLEDNGEIYRVFESGGVYTKTYVVLRGLSPELDTWAKQKQQEWQAQQDSRAAATAMLREVSGNDAISVRVQRNGKA